MMMMMKMKMNRSLSTAFILMMANILLMMTTTMTTVEGFTVVGEIPHSSRYHCFTRPTSSSSSFSTSTCYMSSISSSSSNEQQQLQRAGEVHSSTTDITSGTSPSESVTKKNENNSNIETNVYMKNLIQTRWKELPASSLALLKNRQMKQVDQQKELDVLEQMIGRMAMIGAMGIILRECHDGQSILEQIMSIVQ
jgi:hypothetical protein